MSWTRVYAAKFRNVPGVADTTIYGLEGNAYVYQSGPFENEHIKIENAVVYIGDYGAAHAYLQNGGVELFYRPDHPLHDLRFKSDLLCIGLSSYGGFVFANYGKWSYQWAGDSLDIQQQDRNQSYTKKVRRWGEWTLTGNQKLEGDSLTAAAVYLEGPRRGQKPPAQVWLSGIEKVCPPVLLMRDLR